MTDVKSHELEKEIRPEILSKKKRKTRLSAGFMTYLGLSIFVLTIGYTVGVVLDKSRFANPDSDKLHNKKSISENSESSSEKGEAQKSTAKKKRSNQSANAKNKSLKRNKSQAMGKRSRPKNKDSAKLAPYIKTTPVNLDSHRITFRATGRIAAKNILNITSDVAGELIELNPQLESGELLKKGALIAKLDASALSRQLIAAKAKLAQAQASLEQEQARAKQAKIDLKRSGIKNPSSLALRRPQLISAKASITSLNTEITDLKKDLAKVTIKSPVNAMVLKRGAQLGDQLGVATPIVELIDIDVFTVSISLTKQELLWLGTEAIREQRAITVWLDESPEHQWQAKLQRLSPQVDNKTQSLTVFADLTKPYDLVPISETFLRVGSAVNVEFTGRTIPKSMWIETAAIQEAKYVWTVDENLLLQRAPVAIIKTNDNENKKSLVKFFTNNKNYVNNARTSFTKGLKVRTTLDPSSDDASIDLVSPSPESEHGQ